MKNSLGRVLIAVGFSTMLLVGFAPAQGEDDPALQVLSVTQVDETLLLEVLVFEELLSYFENGGCDDLSESECDAVITALVESLELEELISELENGGCDEQGLSESECDALITELETDLASAQDLVMFALQAAVNQYNLYIEMATNLAETLESVGSTISGNMRRGPEEGAMALIILRADPGCCGRQARSRLLSVDLEASRVEEFAALPYHSLREAVWGEDGSVYAIGTAYDRDSGQAKKHGVYRIAEPGARPVLLYAFGSVATPLALAVDPEGALWVSYERDRGDGLGPRTFIRVLAGEALDGHEGPIRILDESTLEADAPQQPHFGGSRMVAWESSGLSTDGLSMIGLSPSGRRLQVVSVDSDYLHPAQSTGCTRRSEGEGGLILDVASQGKDVYVRRQKGSGRHLWSRVTLDGGRCRFENLQRISEGARITFVNGYVVKR